jgi:hypothetical protein
MTDYQLAENYLLITPAEALTLAEMAMTRRRLTSSEESLLAHMIALAHRATPLQPRSPSPAVPGVERDAPPGPVIASGGATSRTDKDN